MTQANIPKKKPSIELQALRQRVAELEALEVKRQTGNKPLQLKDEQLYKAVFESANDSLFLVDKKGNILDFNDRLTEIGGYEKEELVGKNIRSLAGMITRKSLVIMITNFLKRMANISVPPYEVEMYKKNGELLTVEISARPLRKDGKIIGDLAILRDVTERKRAENEIRQKSSEIQLINSINDAANRGLSLTELIQVVSEEIQTLYGGFAAITYFLNEDKQYLVAKSYKFPSRMSHAIEKLIQMKISEVKFKLKAGGIHDETLRTGKVQMTKDSLVIKQMSEEYTDDKTLQKLLPAIIRIMGLNSLISVPLISEGEAIGLLDIARHEPLTDCNLERLQTIASQFVNVIKRKRAEEALKESETRYHELVNTITSGVIIYKAVDNGEDFVFVDVNSAAEKLERINRQDIIGKRITEVLPGAKDFAVFQVLQKVWQTGNSEYFSSGVHNDESDPGKWRDNWAYKLPSGEIVNVYNDITDKKLAEEALKASEEKYSTLVEQSTDGIVILINRLVEFANCKMNEMTGYSQYEIIGKYFYELTAPEFKEMLDEICKKMQSGEELSGNHEMEILTKDKRKIAVDTKVQPIIYRGKAAGMVIIRDISESKQAEEVLKASEEKYSTLIEKSSDGIVILNVHEIEFSNTRMCEMSGYSQNEILGKNFFDLVAPEHLERLQENYQGETADGTKTDNIEIEILSKDKKKIPVETSAQIIVYKDRPATMVTIRDITQRKRAEEALKVSEQNFRNSIDSSSLGIRISDIDNHTLYANQTLLDIFGYKNIDEVSAKSPQEYYSPESYADYLKMMEIYGRGEIIPNQVDISIVRKDGTIRHLQAVFKEVFWNGKLQYQTLYNDITENKKIEVALRESEEKYRTIFESANDILILLNATGKILDVNKRLTEMGGYDRYELIDKNITELTHIIDEKNMAIVVGNLWKMINSGEAVTYPVEMIKKNREPIFLEINAVPIQKGGKVVGVLGILRDITERHKSELLIRESEEKYRTIFESANDILILLDTSGKILDVNGRLTEIGGYDRYELIDKNILELTHIIDEKNLEIVVANMQKIVAGSGIVIYQIEMIKKNREPIFMEINAVPTRKDGNVVGILGILRDITERNKSELQIREQKALTDRILKSTPNVVAVVGRDQRIIMVNKAFQHTFELGEGQAEGKNIRKFIPIPHLVDTISQVLASGETRSQIEFRIKQGAAVRVWITDIISMQQNEVLIVLRDITEEREMQERLYLTDRLASVGEMAAGIAHELNNPLTGVVALSQLLLESGVPDEMKDDITAISKEGQRAAEVVRNLLSFARSHTLSISSTDINVVIKEVLKLRAYEHNVNNITVTTNLSPDLSEIMTDRFQMQQVFLNIILNAEHAMIESNGRGNLTVTTEQLNDIIKISFTNDGPTIPPDIINRIFDPFFTTKDVGKGTGLGLSICYGIVTKQGGRIYAQSQEGKGATFIVELPVKSH